MNLTCRICSNSANNRTYQCHERMFGWGDEFTYFQCNQCNCLQIAQTPKDLGRFYPPNYYSFQVQPVPQSGWKAWLAARRDRAVVADSGCFGKLLSRLFSPPEEIVTLGKIPVTRQMRILDIGCGRGQFLSVLHRAGFQHLAGIDPYLENDIEVLPGLFVRKMAVENVEEKFDLLMLHHVFEHIAFPQKMLESCRQKLRPGGRILLRFPTVESEAWEKYRDYWVQFDAPRHLFLHSRKSLNLLAQNSGLRVESCWCDSTSFQFWGSELYLQGYSLFGHKNVKDIDHHFGKAKMTKFADQAVKLNEIGRGDQLSAVLIHA